MEWVSQKTMQYNLAAAANNVLEVGSRNINGSVRPIFGAVREYVGVDFEPGPDVDLVLNSHDLTSAFPQASFDVVVSTEMLEHDNEFWKTVDMMGAVLKPGGYLLITARGNGFWVHGYPHDYYRFLPESFRHLLAMAGCDVLEITEDWYPGHSGLFGLGRKRTVLGPTGQ
jgi:SAM-dependent methyltransferase